MGTQIDIVFSYEIEKTIKSGKRGSVYLVRSKSGGARRIYRDFVGSGEVYARLRDVSCPNLPRVYDVSERDGRVFVLEEYIHGDTLAFLLEGGPLTLSSTLDIGIQVCHALDTLHQFGGIHRDVKPENIMIRGREAVLIDFDASRLVKPKIDTDTRIMGTTGYAAPEQYGFSQTDARADIYAMGILLNEMLTGQHPSKRLAEGPLRPVIERCIEVNVDKRYAAARQLREALEACVPSRRRRARPLILAAAAAVLALAILGGVKLLRPAPKQALEAPPTEAPTETAALPPTEAPTEPPTETPTEAPAEPSTQAPAETDPLTVSDEPWQGSSGQFETAFLYDLDGDGEKELYYFGIFQQNFSAAYQHMLYDRSAVASGNNTVNRTVFPCVWKVKDDNSREMITEFIPLLKEARIRVWRKEGNEADAPEIFAASGFCPGGILVTYTHRSIGTWYYEISATLDSQPLTALAMTEIVPYAG